MATVPQHRVIGGVRARAAVVAAGVRDGACGRRLPALVLGLEPIVIGLVGSIVVREHVSGRLYLAFAIGLVGRGRDRRLRERERRGAPCCRSRRSLRSSRCSRRTASPCARWRHCRPPRSCAWHRRGRRRGAADRRDRDCARGCRSSTHAGASSRRWHSRVRGSGRIRLARLGGRALARARCGRGPRPLHGPDRRSDRRHVVLDEPLYARHAVGAVIVIAPARSA